MYENHDKKITDKIFIKVAGLIQRYVKISWLFSLNRLSLLRLFLKVPIDSFSEVMSGSHTQFEE